MMRLSIPFWILLFGMVSLVIHNDNSSATAFTGKPTYERTRIDSRSTQLSMGNLWDDFQNWMSGGGNNDEPPQNENDDEDLPAGTTRVVTLPVKSIKPGGLRLFLMFYFMGLQNTPDRNTWIANQGEDYVVDFRFHDQTALLSVELKDSEITVDRVGSAPSTAYMMQESVIVEGLLDELDSIEKADDVQPEDRLLVLYDNVIEDARMELSFG